MTAIEAEYILPLKWSDDAALADVTEYLAQLSTWVDVTIVDGSSLARFNAHARAWGRFVRHVPVAVTAGANGKVRGVLTGLAIARHERVILADDDVRYDEASLRAVVDALTDADMVRPQNHFVPLPWHARWDTGRMLLNRALAADYPGTYGVRRSALERTGGYDADVLFENLEMERTLRAAGARVAIRRDILIARRPPSARHFLSQRVRQAYDDFAQPVRLAVEASLLPLVVATFRRRSVPIVLAGAVALAEIGRRRAGGRAVFPPTSALWAPAWVAERSVTVWAALVLRIRGGVRYGGRRIARAATPMRTLRARHGRCRPGLSGVRERP
ncbi:glycosyltransferase [Microbacterium sp. RD1]|uniref:glycosyltransferase n=1 Tax=Microbacterium sp. RD1 TaxID=3457313 RepID=UPI003FA60912